MAHQAMFSPFQDVTRGTRERDRALQCKKNRGLCADRQKLCPYPSFRGQVPIIRACCLFGLLLTFTLFSWLEMPTTLSTAVPKSSRKRRRESSDCEVHLEAKPSLSWEKTALANVRLELHRLQTTRSNDLREAAMEEQARNKYQIDTQRAIIETQTLELQGAQTEIEGLQSELLAGRIRERQRFDAVSWANAQAVDRDKAKQELEEVNAKRNQELKLAAEREVKLKHIVAILRDELSIVRAREQRIADILIATNGRNHKVTKEYREAIDAATKREKNLASKVASLQNALVAAEIKIQAQKDETSAWKADAQKVDAQTFQVLSPAEVVKSVPVVQLQDVNAQKKTNRAVGNKLHEETGRLQGRTEPTLIAIRARLALEIMASEDLRKEATQLRHRTLQAETALYKSRSECLELSRLFNAGSPVAVKLMPVTVDEVAMRYGIEPSPIAKVWQMFNCSKNGMFRPPDNVLAALIPSAGQEERLLRALSRWPDRIMRLTLGVWLNRLWNFLSVLGVPNLFPGWVPVLSAIRRAEDICSFT